MVWAGGDATTTKVAGIDWSGKKFMADDIQDYYATIRELMPEAPEDVVISAAEVMCLLLLASLRSEAWCNRIVLYVSDNQNVVTWFNLNKRQSKVVQGLRVRWLGEEPLHLVTGEVPHLQNTEQCSSQCHK